MDQFDLAAISQFIKFAPPDAKHGLDAARLAEFGFLPPALICSPSDSIDTPVHGGSMPHTNSPSGRVTGSCRYPHVQLLRGGRAAKRGVGVS